MLQSILDALGPAPEVPAGSVPAKPAADHTVPRVWQPPVARKSAGLAISLYGLRSERNWGCGDLGDLRQLIDWAVGALDASFIALNPLHAIHNRQPYNTSPYLPLCSYYRNFLYLDVAAVPGTGPYLPPATVLAELRASEFVEYERVAELKLGVLQRTFDGFQGDPAFDEFKRQQGELLEDFSLFCALDEHFRRTRPGTWLWTDWPADCQHPRHSGSRAFFKENTRAVEFWMWLQWQLDRQLDAVQQHARDAGMPLGLYHDLALATDRYGCDLWANPDHFARGCRVGAPPDDFSPEGQDWAFPPPNSAQHLRDGYQLFTASIRNNARHGGALRLDHVMRLFRLFWIPEGFAAKDGTYVEERWADLLAVLARESAALGVRIIGEDLGTVTDAMRQALNESGILGYRVLYFEREHDGRFKHPSRYSSQAVATVTTHDLPTLAGFWSGADIEARRAAGLADEEVCARHRAERARDRQNLLDCLHEWQLVPSGTARLAAEIPQLGPELVAGVIELLAQTSCELLVVNQEELTGEVYQQNLPGSTAQYPNWRRKMTVTLEELDQRPDMRAMTNRIRDIIIRHDRGLVK
ncbi:MAG: 4-alpha-glucanotransferase [Acidobacteria bacterium]|nr:4-alpha-glucanotransferase [Acidobacteriota bacterium]